MISAKIRTIKMRTTDVKSSTFIDLEVKNNDEDPKFKVYDHVSISKYKNIFAKGCSLNWSQEVFHEKIENTVPWTYVIEETYGEKTDELFYERELWKKNQVSITQQFGKYSVWGYIIPLIPYPTSVFL